MGASEMSMPLTETAVEVGHDISLVLEGLAAKNYDKLIAWRNQVEKPVPSIFFRGTVDFRDYPFTLDAKACFEKMKPDVVVVTMSSPINLEDQIGEAANALGIPVVALNDFWGGLTRAKKTKADLMLAIDKVDAAAAGRHFKGSHNFKISVVGNHAVNKARSLSPSAEIQIRMAELKRRFGKVILFAGGGAEYTGAEINLLVECLKKTPGAWVAIKRYHGKHMNRTAPDGRTWKEVWDEQFAALGDRVIELTTPEGDAVAKLCDCAISGFSTMMTTAVASYKSAVALITPETKKSFEAQTTFRRYPLSILSLVPDISAPVDLTPYFNNVPDKATVDYLLKPYDPVLALAEIEKLLK